MPEGLVLLAHGSPDERGVADVRDLVARVAARLPEVQVLPGFLGHAEPDVPSAVAELAGRGCDRVTVVPLLLTPGAHATRDVPAEVAGVRVDITLAVAEAIGGHPALVDAVIDLAGAPVPGRTLVLVAGGGSPEADAEAARVAHLAASMADFDWAAVGFTGSRPTISDVLTRVGPGVVVVPYLLGRGVMLDRAGSAGLTTAPIGSHPGVVEAVVQRWRDAPHGTPGGGWVALVGAGPGDLGLLTRRAAELLAAADVVVSDRLAPDVAALAPQAELIDVGKGPGHGTLQEDINALLVQRARAGQRVVRIKGGDPFVFGRGGEEWLACQAAGVRVDVVPGVTSAIAGPAAAGIPVTHRGVAAALTIISAHVPPGHEHDPHDWEALAKVHGTLVVLMGASTLAEVTSELIRCGRDPRTPAAVVHRAWLPGQQIARAGLDRIKGCGLTNPAILVVGEVVDVLGTLG